MKKKFIIVFLFLAFVGGCAAKPMVSMEKAGVQETMDKPFQKFTAIVAGGMHTCALLLDGTAKCWGANVTGQLGNETVEEISTTPVAVIGISNIKAIAAGVALTCVILADGKVKCFGIDIRRSESDLEAIDPKTMPKLFSRPVEIDGISNATVITTGWWGHICVILADSKVKCWGENSTGQLGEGTTINSTIPVEVKGISNAVAITAGVAHTCVVLSNGSVKCWGTDSFGKSRAFQEGKIFGFSSLTPIEIKGISNATSVSAGRNHTCALLSDGSVKCWGSNILGQLGSIIAFTSATPLKVEGISNAITISAGPFCTCTLHSDGTVKCWGAIPEPFVSKPNVYPIPLTVEGISNAVALAAGGMHTCALLKDGTVKCWGMNQAGQLGNGLRSDFSSTPVTVIESQPKENK